MTEIFNFMDQKVRVVVLEGAPWFVAKDVCQVLEMRPDRGGSYFQRLVQIPPVERRVLRKGDYLETIVSSVFDGTSNSAYVISESGLYKLIMRSNKPEAKAFQDWVTREVLPAIRKDGMYVQGEEKAPENQTREHVWAP